MLQEFLFCCLPAWAAIIAALSFKDIFCPSPSILIKRISVVARIIA